MKILDKSKKLGALPVVWGETYTLASSINTTDGCHSKLKCLN